MSTTTAARLSALAGLVLLILSSGGCVRGEPNVLAGNRDGIFYFGNSTEPQSLDPHVMSGQPEVNIARALFEGLVTRNPITMDMDPGVAQRWTISEDGKVYTFYLNPEARWSNGDPVTATDFVWSITRSIHPLMGNQVAYTLFPILNARAFGTGELADETLLGIQALDTHTLQINLENPDPFFLETLGTYPAYPVHRATVEAHGEPTDRFTRWTRAENFVGNGAFTLSEWLLNRRLTVTKSETYWDAERVKLNQVVFYPIENLVSEEKMFRTGQLHFTNQVPVSKIPWYRDLPDSPYHQGPQQGTYFLSLNIKREPLTDLRVRQALAMAIDRDRLISSILYGTAVPSAAMVPLDTPGYRSPPGAAYNPEKAKALLAEAGFPDGEGWPGLEYLYNTNEQHRSIAVALQQMWKDTLNIDITLVNQEWKVYLDTTNEKNYDMARMGWLASTFDPLIFLDIFTSTSGINRTNFADARFDKLVKELIPRSVDDDRRLALTQEAEAIVLDNVPAIPLYNYMTKHLVQPSVTGAPSNELDIQNFKY
ncbi:MAG: peptide ABC transporter substrate-binding protein, partial [Pseudomonadota bacterium]